MAPDPAPTSSPAARATGRRLSAIRRPAALLLAAALTAGGCAATDYQKDVVNRSNEIRTGPQERPQMNMTSFASSLRCMDILFLNYGVRDLTVLIEDIPDATRKINASGKDMIISAVSQMTRRSRGVNLMAFSVNDQTLGVLIGVGTRNKLVETPPDFTIRGSVSQFDESIVRKQGDAGIGIGAFSAGVAKQAQGSILAVDLSVINTNTLNLVPGVTSKNSVLVLKQGDGADGEVNTRKFGINFSFVLSQSEGNAQALRTLAEMAAIELLGKLTKIPYWTCLGAKDTDEGVEAEITDWWETMAANPVSLVAYFQQQMIARGLYPGQVDGEVNDTLLHAIAIYQRAMGREASSTLNYDFFRAYLAADHAALQPKALALLKDNPGPPLPGAAPVAAAPEVTAKGSAAAAGAASTNVPPSVAQSTEPPFVYVAGSQGRNSVHRRGQAFDIDVAVDQDTNLYCFMVDEYRRVNQFFPNPIAPDPQVRAGTRMQFPGPLPFRFVASPRGANESIACYAAPAALGAEPLKSVTLVRSTDELTQHFRKLAGPRIGIGVYDVKTQ